VNSNEKDTIFACEVNLIMKKRFITQLTLIVALLALTAVGEGSVYAQEVPKEIKLFLENYNKDSTVEGGPLHAKKSRFLSDTVKIKDVSVGRVLQRYKFKHVFLDEYPDTIAFSEIIEPSGSWCVLITAHGKPAYELWLKLDKTSGKVRFAGMSELSPEGGMWSELEKAYPVSSGINPLYFTMFDSPYLLYFKQLGPRKLCYYYIGGVKDERLAERFPGPIGNLGDSRRYIEYLKMKGINEIGMSREQLEDKRRQEGKEFEPGIMGDR
jgi:hypothetical protein